MALSWHFLLSNDPTSNGSAHFWKLQIHIHSIETCSKLEYEVVPIVKKKKKEYGSMLVCLRHCTSWQIAETGAGIGPWKGPKFFRLTELTGVIVITT